MRLRVATYNLLNGGEGREPQLREVLSAANADLIVLQEVYDNGLVPRLGEALGMTAQGWWMPTGHCTQPRRATPCRQSAPIRDLITSLLIRL
jgi:hypothetical protein